MPSSRVSNEAYGASILAIDGTSGTNISSLKVEKCDELGSSSSCSF
jgi:methionine synthase I (cobalamin-dependent)